MTEDTTIDTVRLDDARKPEAFTILGEAGAGGMGVVYKASAQSGRLVALKVMNVATGDPARFALETSVIKKLVHENIVAYYSHGVTADGKPFLAMEWLEGEALDAVIVRGALSVDETLRIARSVARALVCAHAEGVVHRDLKPSNVMLTKTGEVKLLDFGVARILELGAGLTTTGQVIGTPGFMAPEQARGDDDIDARADLFALGALIYVMLAGRKPFEASGAVPYLTKLLFESPTPLESLVPTVPPWLAALTMRLLARERIDRPNDAHEALELLERMQSSTASTQPKAVAPSTDQTLASKDHATAGSPARRSARPILLASLGAGLVGAAVLSVVLATKHPAEVTPQPAASLPAESSTPVLERACATWAAKLVEAQRADGSFTGEQHRPATVWDTAQQLYAVARASRVCKIDNVAAEDRGARAILGYQNEAGRASLEVPALAWSSLAHSTLRDPARVSLGSSTGSLSNSALQSGAFPFLTSQRALDPYATVLGTFALTEAVTLGQVDLRLAAQHAVRALADALAHDERLHVPGLEEQATWVLARVDQTIEATDAIVLRARADSLLAHCAPNAVGDCTRHMTEDEWTPLDYGERDGGRARLLHLWHPWFTLAVRELASRRDLGFDVATKNRLAAAAAWGERELVRSVDAIGLVPEYKLAEYLMVVTFLLER